MDKMNIRITAGLLSIAMLLISDRAKTTRLAIKPANILIAISGFFQLVFKGINCQLINVARFNSNWNTATFLLPIGDAVLNSSPARINLPGNNITGNRLNSNFFFSINIGTNVCVSQMSSVISLASAISNIVLPDFSVSQSDVIKQAAVNST